VAGEYKVALRGIELGFDVLKPINTHSVVDLVFYKNNKYYKIQCKYVSKNTRDKSYRVRLYSRTFCSGGERKNTLYKSSDVDVVAAYLKEDDKVVFFKNRQLKGNCVNVTCNNQGIGKVKLENYLSFPL
jgi:hypothetical protein